MVEQLTVSVKTGMIFDSNEWMNETADATRCESIILVLVLVWSKNVCSSHLSLEREFEWSENAADTANNGKISSKSASPWNKNFISSNLASN